MMTTAPAGQKIVPVPTVVPSDQGQISPFENAKVPTEVLFEIFRKLSVSDAAAACLVCREWDMLINDNSLWKFFAKRDVMCSFKRPETEPAKESYRINLNLIRGVYSTTVIQTGNNSEFCCIHARKLFTGSMAGSIQIWDLDKGKCLKTFLSTMISSVVPIDSDKLISGSISGKIQILDLHAFTSITLKKRHRAMISALLLANNGQQLLSGSHDKTIRVWDLNKGTCERVLKGHQDQIQSLCFTPEGELLSSSMDGAIRVWNLETGDCIQVVTSRYMLAKSLLLTHQREIVADCINAGISIWDLDTGEHKGTLDAGQSGTRSFCLSEGRTLISVCNKDSTIKIWDLAARNCLGSFKIDAAEIRFIALINDAGLILVTLQGEIRILDFKANKAELGNV